MKVVQYRHDSGVRLGALIQDHVVDLAAALRRRGVAPTFTGAMATARHEGVPLPRLVETLLDESDAEATWAMSAPSSMSAMTLDEAAAAVVANGQRYPLAPPVDAPEVWASGVTYLRSRAARMEESGVDHRDFYDRVYEAQRPELFMKDAAERRTVASGEDIGVRGDSTWTVPEPELALVIDRDGTIVAYTAGDDVTARDVEGQNPLYLPQAKVFTRACALGPTALLAEAGDDHPTFTVALRITEPGGRTVYEASIGTDAMRRTFPELVRHLLRFNTIADGTVLLTGTGLVPPDDQSLGDGHRVEVEIPGIGVLWNSSRVLS